MKKAKIFHNTIQHLKHFFAILLFVGLLASCSGESTETEAEKTVTGDHHATVMKASQAYFDAIKAVDAEKVVSFWIEDLKVIQSSGEDIVGKVAFREFLDAFYPTLQVHEVEISRNEVEVAPTFATQTVQFSEQVSMNGGEIQTIEGRYFAVWKNLPRQGWKIHRMVSLPAGNDPIHNPSGEE